MGFLLGGSGMRNAGLAGASDDPFSFAGSAALLSPSVLTLLSGSMNL